MEMHTNRGKVKGEYKVVILFTMRLLESYLSNTKNCNEAKNYTCIFRASCCAIENFKTTRPIGFFHVAVNDLRFHLKKQLQKSLVQDSHLSDVQSGSQ